MIRDNTPGHTPEDWMKWLIQLHEEFSKETDRAAVILSASMIENSLEELVKARLVPSSGAEDPLFDGPTAPLGSFSAKIEMALRLGVLSDQFARDLHLLRRIRNDFAHNITGCAFDDTTTRSRVSELMRSWRYLQNGVPRENLPPGVRNDFFYVIGWMLVSIRIDLANVQSLNRAEIEFGYRSDDWSTISPTEQTGQPNLPNAEPSRT